MPKGPYSVAQHCAIGAAAILRDTGDAELAALFLLHDAHEAYLGDWSRPLQMALEQMVGHGRGSQSAESARRNLRDALDDIRRFSDSAIFEAARVLPPPPWNSKTPEVKRWDERMLETERRLFLGTGTRAWHWDDNPPTLVRWPEKPVVWPWPVAADKWLTLFRQLCPSALVTAA